MLIFHWGVDSAWNTSCPKPSESVEHQQSSSAVPVAWPSYMPTLWNLLERFFTWSHWKKRKSPKVQPLVDYVKRKWFEFYQPRQQVAVDERMVKSKARSHLIQYMHNKPVKWGFKFWVIADMTGYILDFNVYTGRSADRTDYGLSHDVVMELIQPLVFQGYEVYLDNFYSSPELFDHLLEWAMCSPWQVRQLFRQLCR